ncbi:radical SAM protein [Halomonas sp.]|uniref:radical SAM protein n=1 Tax=Halomonas sp. TaxID=1486246 RepID=UPI00298E7D8A|nr:radical SAM protein [Halomonas sp.]MDW7745524.1 radical SAM protein [Halomonas sp.]
MIGSLLRLEPAEADDIRLPVASLTASSTVDFPGRRAAVIHLQGCPLQCGYCEVSEMASPRRGEPGEWESMRAFLEARPDGLDAVVFSGGEPTLHADLPRALAQAREMGRGLEGDANGPGGPRPRAGARDGTGRGAAYRRPLPGAPGRPAAAARLGGPGRQGARAGLRPGLRPPRHLAAACPQPLAAAGGRHPLRVSHHGALAGLRPGGPGAPGHDACRLRRASLCHPTRPAGALPRPRLLPAGGRCPAPGGTGDPGKATHAPLRARRTARLSRQIEDRPQPCI